MKPDILIVAPLRPRFMAELDQHYTVHRLDLAAPEDRDALVAAVAPRCRAIVANGHVTVDKALLNQLPELRLVACSSAGYETIDIAELARRGITLTNTSDALVNDVADTALMLMLATRRRLIEAHEHVRSGDWGRNGSFPLTSATAGKRAGIVGLGNIGKAIARRCDACEMTVGYFGRRRQLAISYEYYAKLIALAEWSDVLFVATPGGAGTEGLISADVLNALGPEGVLINIARGSVVDEAALIAALTSGRLGSAGLDVFVTEPDPDPALTRLGNVTLYPHHASGTEETRDGMARLVLDNLAAFYAGQAPLTPVKLD